MRGRAQSPGSPEGGSGRGRYEILANEKPPPPQTCLAAILTTGKTLNSREMRRLLARGMGRRKGRDPSRRGNWQPPVWLHSGRKPVRSHLGKLLLGRLGALAEGRVSMRNSHVFPLPFLFLLRAGWVCTLAVLGKPDSALQVETARSCPWKLLTWFCGINGLFLCG